MSRYILTGIIFLGVIGESSAADFDCGKAETSVERLICSDSQLSEMDDKLSVKYKQQLARAVDTDKKVPQGTMPNIEWSAESQTKNRQVAWLNLERNTCITVDCLKAEYLSRLSDFDDRGRSTEGEARFDLLPKASTIPDRVFGTYTAMADLTSVNENHTGFEKYGEHEDYVKIVDAKDGNANVEIWLTFENNHVCQFEGTGVWRENHVEVYEQAELNQPPCRLRLYSDGKAVLLRDPGHICAQMSCGARGSLDRSRLNKNVP